MYVILKCKLNKIRGKRKFNKIHAYLGIWNLFLSMTNDLVVVFSVCIYNLCSTSQQQQCNVFNQITLIFYQVTWKTKRSSDKSYLLEEEEEKKRKEKKKQRIYLYSNRLVNNTYSSSSDPISQITVAVILIPNKVKSFHLCS